MAPTRARVEEAIAAQHANAGLLVYWKYGEEFVLVAERPPAADGGAWVIVLADRGQLRDR